MGRRGQSLRFPPGACTPTRSEVIRVPLARSYNDGTLYFNNMDFARSHVLILTSPPPCHTSGVRLNLPSYLPDFRSCQSLNLLHQ